MALYTAYINTGLALQPWNATTAPGPAAPVFGTASSTSSTISLNWTGPAGAYTLQRAPVTNGVPGTFTTLSPGPGTTASYTDSALPFNSTYDYRVSVTVNGATSPFSQVVRATTVAGGGSPFISDFQETI